jgi:hypothetical protein
MPTETSDPDSGDESDDSGFDLFAQGGMRNNLPTHALVSSLVFASLTIVYDS